MVATCYMYTTTSLALLYPNGLLNKFMFQEEEGTAPNNRGYSSVFGPDITKKFLADNNLLYIVRSHECVQQGFTLSHNDTVSF